MTNEEFNKKMEFIVDQQAQLVVNQEKAGERMTQLENVVGHLENVVGRLENVVGRLATASLERFENIEEKMDALVDAQIRLTESTSERFRNSEDKMDALVDAQARTDENMRNLIAVVDRYFSEGRNGKSKG